MVTIPNGNVGMAGLNTDTFSVVELFAGDTPNVVTENEILLDQNAAVPAFTVVGKITATGKVTVCDLAANDGSQVPYGITTAPTLDTGADIKIAVFTSGCFNPAALNWHASFDTDAKKLAAFDAKTNGAIKLRATLG